MAETAFRENDFFDHVIGIVFAADYRRGLEQGKVVAAAGAGAGISFDSEYVQRLVLDEPRTVSHFCGYFGGLIGLKLRRRLSDAQRWEHVRNETLVRVLEFVRSHPSEIERPDQLGVWVNTICDEVVRAQTDVHIESFPSVNLSSERAQKPSLESEWSDLTARKYTVGLTDGESKRLAELDVELCHSEVLHAEEIDQIAGDRLGRIESSLTRLEKAIGELHSRSGL